MNRSRIHANPDTDKRCSVYGSMVSVISLFILLASFTVGKAQASEATVELKKAPIDLTDPASLQRGAQIFMNHCSGCHGLKYMRYHGMAQDIGIVDKDGKVLEDVVKNDLMFVGDKIGGPIITSMTVEEGKKWFGIAPPDLTLVARVRGPDWIYTYLRSFYPDLKKTWGVNNKVYPDVAMPDVLYNIRQNMSEQEFDAYIADLVNFLTYTGEPMQLKRKFMGVWVLIFLGIFFVFTILLKREYWKKVK